MLHQETRRESERRGDTYETWQSAAKGSETTRNNWLVTVFAKIFQRQRAHGSEILLGGYNDYPWQAIPNELNILAEN